MVFLLGTPELALPSEWADARARIDDGTLPTGAVVDIVSVVLVLAWGAGLWFLLAGVLKRDESTQDESTYDESAHDESTHDETDIPITNDGSEPDEPWYRQGPPIFDEPFSDEYPRVVVPPDEMTPDDGPQDSVWQPATMTADVGDPLGMMSPHATAEDMFSDAEIIGDAGGSNPDEHPMIVPVRAYYFTRAEDTLRSISAQFLHTPKRWQELRSLNAASPGVAAVGPDTLLPAGTALALPGDPVPWGNPDPVYLWTLAEKFLFTAWGREPTPEEVVPFWRGLTSGTQLEAGAPPARPEYLAAPTEPPAPEIAREPAPTPTEPPAPSDFWSPPPAFARDGALAGPSRLPATASNHPTGIRIPRTPNPRTSPRASRLPTPARIRIPRTPNPRTSPGASRLPATASNHPTGIRIPRTTNPRTTPTRIRTSPRASRLPTAAPSHATRIRIPRTTNPRTTPTRIRTAPRAANPRTTPTRIRIPRTTNPRTTPTRIRIPRTTNPRTTPTRIRTTPTRIRTAPRAANPRSPRLRPHRA